MEPTASETPMLNSVLGVLALGEPITTIARKASAAIPMMKIVTRSTCLVSGVFSTFCSGQHGRDVTDLRAHAGRR